MKTWKRWLPFLLLNILVSSLTTITVITLWNRLNPATQLTVQVSDPRPPVSSEATALPADLPPLDVETLKIVNVIAAGDLNNEVVILERVGEGELNLTGWSLKDAEGQRYVLPELVVFKGQLEVYSRMGTNSVNRLFWGARTAVWSTGETVTLLDSAEQVRAEFVIP